MILSERSCVNLSLIALCIKMLLTPWAAGDYENETIKMLNYACDGVILLAVLAYVPFTFKLFSFTYLIFSILLISFVISTITFTNNSAFEAVSTHLRVYSPILFFTMLASYFYKKPSFAISISIKFCLYTAILLIVGLLTLPPSVNRLEVWWPSYFGGTHTTSFMAMSIFFISFALFITGKIKQRQLFLIGVGVFFAVSMGWGVRTVSVAILILLGAFYLNKMRFESKKGLLHAATISVFLIFTFLITFVFDYSSFNNLTSGRISMYAKKIEQLSDNSFANWLIGNGAGSDLIETEFWWWGAKGAHSDFITFLVEGGIVYFGLTFFVLFKLFKLIKNSEGKLLIAAFVFTSLISNGYLVRPLPSYLFFFSLAIMFAFFNHERER